MNKSELVDAVALAADISKVAATRSLDAILEKITESLQKNDPVVLVGFGTFAVRERPARVGRNPQTGESMQIKASKVPVFKAGKSFKDALQGNVKAKKKEKEVETETSK